MLGHWLFWVAALFVIIFLRYVAFSGGIIICCATSCGSGLSTAFFIMK